MSEKKRIVVLISGSGSNLQAIIDAVNSGFIAADISAVISNKSEAFGLTRATEAGIATQVLDHKQFNSREEFDSNLASVIDRYQPDIIVLAGFMRILTPEFVKKYQGKMINIHPSLLPKYQGLNTHQRALDAGDSHHGASVHFVTEELDGGPVIIQGSVAISPGDSAESLAAKVLVEEHRIFPQAVKWMAEDRLKLVNNQALLDGQLIPVN
ncbi:MAG: phosphoribosylglycinamide formyltransferase [Hahellaceae bacterium]|nr:phosphoribosylglycinamide formyltransferase [Hahellaceae bacterium]MCP5213208.1 phosphoribosylglycinamide formyltransferase [Hahellaceae bacterium]